MEYITGGCSSILGAISLVFTQVRLGMSINVGGFKKHLGLQTDCQGWRFHLSHSFLERRARTSDKDCLLVGTGQRPKGS